MRQEGFVRNLVFGVEDSLVSTVGFISGIAAASISRESILLSGVVLVCVEAFSMGIGSVLSEESVQEARAQRGVGWSAAVAGGLVMFTSYIITGLAVLAPYAFHDVARAMPESIILSLGLLCALGAVSAHISKLPMLVRALRMMLLGGAAIALGIFVGQAMP